MAINTYRFWMATDSNRLLANQNSFIQASPPAFYQGNVANLELYMVASAGVGVTPVDVPFPAGAEISVAVGNTNAYPTGGFWELSVDDVETAPMPHNATTTQVAAALNALASVTAAGGVSVSKTGDGYTITWNTYGLKPTIGIGSDTLTPSSYESISLVQTGSAEHRQIVFVELRQNPVALSTTWTPLPQPSITSTLVKAWDGSSVIWRVTIYPQPKAGTMTLSYGTKTTTLDVFSSATTISIGLEAQVFSTGQYQWDIALAEDSVLTASGNLIGYNGFSGTINFATAECHQFLAGDEGRNTTLEVSISVDSKRYTLIQTGCQIFADVISDGVLVPLPLGVALTEQVANARFVRRDIDQNPDAATQDVIWQNLGVDTLGSDVAGALNAADSPSAANPFATISDIPNVTQAEWGNITGDINNQSDLASALNSLDIQKYDASNPAGYIDGSYLFGYATESWVESQGYITSIDLSGYATQSWVTGQGYITSSALTPYATLLNPSFSGVARFVNPSNYAVVLDDPSTPGYSTSISMQSIYITQNNVENVSMGIAGFKRSSGTQYFGELTSDSVRVANPSGDITMTHAYGIQKDGVELYARKAGDTFTGKVNLATIGVASPSINLGGQCDSAPASATNGDLWISNAASPKLTYRAGGINYNLAVLNQFNTFTGQMVINTTSSSTAALRVTQLGTGNAIEVEDSTSPDATRFVVDQNGKVGVGTAPDATAAIKVDANGISFNGLVFNPTATASHTGGGDTLDLLVTINGTAYRIGLRPA